MKKVEDYISSGILEQFVLGELSADESREVIDMAERHPAIRQEIALIEKMLLDVAEKLAIQPAPAVLDMIKERITAKESQSTERLPVQKNKKIHYLRYGVAATFTLKLVAMAVAANFWIHWQSTERRLNYMQEKYTQLEKNAQQVTQALLTISDPAFQTVVLNGQASQSDVRMLAYWNEETQELYLNVSKLPKPEENKQYQLWGLSDGNIVSLGVFNVAGDASLPQIEPFKGVRGLTALIISLEPAGGNSSPSQDQVYFNGEIR